MSRLRTACAIGLATGAIGVLLSLVPAIVSLEDSLGLRWLFQIRGPLPAPAGVVVVSIDEPAAIRLDLKTQVRDWPRAYHARLIDRLVDQGASVVAFDLRFFRDSPVAADDDALMKAIERSKRVVLVQMLEQFPGAVRRQDPIPAFAGVAASLAPVPIPKTPLVSWFWSFLRVNGVEVPTLPAVALQVGSVRIAALLQDVLKRAGLETPMPRLGTPSEVLTYMQEMRRRLKGNNATLSRVRDQLAMSPQIDDRERQLARAVAALYVEDGAPYLNFYGPPGSVCTVPYEVVLDDAVSPCSITGATVFVGVGRSRVEQAEQIDTYHTIYERPDGVDFSGVELHATAFANLLTGTALRPVNPLAILVGAGLVLGGSAYLTRTRRRRVRGRIHPRVEAAVIVVLLVVACAVVAYVLFARFYMIVPIVIPLAVQLPTALILGLLVRPAVHDEQVQAVCVAADAAGSTAMGQRLPHNAYASLMGEYIRTLAQCVTARGGLALAPQGDGFVSLWILGGSSADAAIRLAACRAALEMTTAASRFNEARPEGEQLPLRLGLTLGAVTIRSDADRGVFEAVGDAVNVASRLQQAGREVGAPMLASAELVEGLSVHVGLRPIDVPLTLSGVAHAPHVFELHAHDPRAAPSKT